MRIGLILSFSRHYYVPFHAAPGCHSFLGNERFCTVSERARSQHRTYEKAKRRRVEAKQSHPPCAAGMPATSGPACARRGKPAEFNRSNLNMWNERWNLTRLWFMCSRPFQAGWRRHEPHTAAGTAYLGRLHLKFNLPGEDGRSSLLHTWGCKAHI